MIIMIIMIIITMTLNKNNPCRGSALAQALRVSDRIGTRSGEDCRSSITHMI